MPRKIDKETLRIARTVARELVRGGASAVVLAGSHARGDAHRYSDVDMVAVYRRLPDEPPAPSRVVRGRLVTVAARTEPRVRRDFRAPRRAPAVVPGWREALVLADPDGVAARLKRAAERWPWDSMAAACDDEAADHLAGLAEEVHKLHGTLALGQLEAAAVQRSILAWSMAGIVALRRHILFGTENVLWAQVNDVMGAEWTRTQRAALALGGESLRQSSDAALRLYALTAREVWPLLDRRQRAVVSGAIAIAGGRVTGTTRRRASRRAGTPPRARSRPERPPSGRRRGGAT
jgi:predicted nucleotidyltransferase